MLLSIGILLRLKLCQATIFVHFLSRNLKNQTIVPKINKTESLIDSPLNV